MNTVNQELTWQLQTSNLELSRPQTDVSYLKTSVERNQSTVGRDAEYLRNLREENTSLARENLRHSAQIQRSTRSLQEAEMETVRVQSLWEDAQMTFLLVEPLKCCCTVGHITACYSRLDTDILLTLTRLDPKSDHEKIARIINCAQRTWTRFVLFPTLADLE